MAKVSLRGYTHDIEGLIEGGQLKEAVGHCQYILKTYSMHVDTYRLLGKAFLESRQYADAADIFQRTLMAVPDDFVTHVGMSIIRDDEKKLDEAIWHMERAFEVQPSNPAIQGELRRLYGRRDGVEPPKIRLSRDALANMYSQGELYSQAIAEIREVLSEDPDRPDLQVMLARAHYRAGNKVEAAEAAATLLKKYPYCLDALRILVDVLPGTAKGENVQVYRQRLQLLDPYSAMTKGSVFLSSQVPDAAIELERLEYHTDMVPTAEPPNWASSLGIKIDEGAQPEPVWMASDQPAESRPPVPTPEEAPAESVGSVTTAPEEVAAESDNSQKDGSIPDWMRSAGWQESKGETLGVPAETAEVLPAEPTAESEIPDWLKSLAPPGFTAQPPEAESEKVPVFPITPEPVLSEDVPDWLKGSSAHPEDKKDSPQESGISNSIKSPNSPVPPTQPAEVTPPGAPTPSPAQEDHLSWLQPDQEAKQGMAEEGFSAQTEKDAEGLPDWLNHLADTPAKPAGSEPPALSGLVGAELRPTPQEEASNPSAEEINIEAQEAAPLISPAEGTSKPLSIEDDTMAWLESLAAKQGAKPEELLTKPENRSETPPDWVQKAVQEQPAQEPEANPVPEEVFEPTPEISAEPPKEKPVEAAPEAPVETAPSAPSAETADSDMTITSWLSKLDVEEAVNKAQAAQKPAIPPSEDLPNWLKDLDKPAPAPQTAQPTEEAPEWLHKSADQKADEGMTEPMPRSWADENIPVVESPAPTSPEEWLPAEKIEAASPEGSPSKETAPPKIEEKPAAPPAPSVARGTGPLAKIYGQDKDAELFSTAQSALNANQLKEAVQEYGKLIKKGHLLEDVIHDLREATYRFPVDIIIWQTLGDAYMKANRLQEALDAYNKAEELLR